MLTSTTGGGQNIYKEKYFKNKKIYGIFGKYHFDVQYSEIQKVNIQILTSQYLVKISNKIYNNILNYSCILQYKLK